MAVQTPPRVTTPGTPSTTAKPETGQPWKERWAGLFFVAPFLLLFAAFLIWPTISGLCALLWPRESYRLHVQDYARALRLRSAWPNALGEPSPLR